MVRKSLKSHLVDPWLEVESINGWNGIIFLLLLKNIVILARGIHTKEHGLGTEDGGVGPLCLDENLGNII